MELQGSLASCSLAGSLFEGYGRGAWLSSSFCSLLLGARVLNFYLSAWPSIIITFPAPFVARCGHVTAFYEITSK